jgi:hypothetical protein
MIDHAILPDMFHMALSINYFPVAAVELHNAATLVRHICDSDVVCEPVLVLPAVRKLLTWHQVAEDTTCGKLGVCCRIAHWYMELCGLPSDRDANTPGRGVAFR